MKDVLSKLFGFLKYILLVVSFGFVLYGIMITYNRLGKSLSEAIGVFIPFGFVLIMFIISLIVKDNKNDNRLLFNFVSCFTFLVIIIICLRSMLDKSMLLYYKYQMNFNSAFFADNLSAIQMMLYMIGSANILLVIYNLLNKKKKTSVNE